MMIRGICKNVQEMWWYNLYRSYFYTSGYRFALACIHGKCRKKVILEYLYEATDSESNGVCCDCCDVNLSNIVGGQKDMIATAKAMKEIPCMGEIEGEQYLGHVSSYE